MPSNDGFAHVLRIDPHPANVRDDLGDLTGLAASIREHGIVQPLVVQPNPRRPGAFIVVAGHRRLAAAKLAGLDEVPVSIRAAAGPGNAIELMLVENCQRSDLNPMEKAEAMGRLRAHGYTAARIAKATGLTISTISYYLSLLVLDAASRELVRDGQVKAAEAVTAVRSVRASDRRSAGKPRRRASVAAPHFGKKHRLAQTAGALCRAASHTAGKLPGGVACGPCWEEAIRDDENGAAPEPEAAPSLAMAGAS
jgi:ParB family transcriptional regulator, chromosome partitioning protein